MKARLKTLYNPERTLSVRTQNQSGTALGVKETAPRVSRLNAGIQKAIATNMEIVSQMEQRLHAVLLPAPSNGVGGSVEPPTSRPVVSPLASDLETFESQLYALSARYTDILNRLEI